MRLRASALFSFLLWGALPPVIALLSLSCATHLISPYSETAYSMAVSLKVDALALVAKAGEPYAQHAAEVEALRLQARKNLEYAKGRPQNEDTARQWEILLDPSGSLLGGFLARWEREKTLGPDFVSEKSTQVGRAFDEVIRLESHKPKEKRE